MKTWILKSQVEQDRQNNEHKVLETERKEEYLCKFVDVHCQSREFVEIPAGQMAIYLQITFDNSDMRSDYYHPYTHIGEPMLLAIVPKQARRCALAQQAMMQHLELLALEWNWKTENYSMGNGNFLLSDFFGQMSQSAYDGRQEVEIRYEIGFSTARQMRAWKHYKAKQAGVAPDATLTNSANNDTVKIRLNDEKQGIEVIFSEKPKSEIISSLKKHGFRWSPAYKLWYAKQAPDRINFANSLVA